MENPSVDFQKVTYENVEKNVHFATNTSMYMGHRYFEIL